MHLNRFCNSQSFCFSSPSFKSMQHNWKVLRNQIIILEHDNQIHFEFCERNVRMNHLPLKRSMQLTNFEVFRQQRGTCEKSRECHINWNLQLGTNIAFGNLNCLNLGGVARITLDAAARLYAHQLQFDRLHSHLGMLHRQLKWRLHSERFGAIASCVMTYVSGEWLRHAAVDGIQVTSDEESWNRYPFFGCLL